VYARASRHEDAIDGCVPRAVVEPSSCAEVSAVIAAVRHRGEAIAVTGGRTQITVGNRPRRLDAILSTRRMAGTIEPRPEDMTVRAEGGVTLAALNRALAGFGQRLAIDPLDPERATVGGVLSTNTTGSLAHGFGHPRDLVLGMTVVDGSGRTLRVGGRVVKNVAGYDLVRLFTGSFGTLGVIAETTLRTHPLPERTAVLAFRFSTWDDAEAARAAAMAASLPLAGLDFETSANCATGTIVARLEGTAREVEAQRDALRALWTGGVPADDAAVRGLHPTEVDTVVVRVGVAPADVLGMLRAVRNACGNELRAAARLGDGSLRVCGRCDDVAEAVAIARAVRAAALSFRGAAFVERLAQEAKTSLDAWGDPPPAMRLMAEIKRRFDPDDVLAPGRFVGGL
jgi:glycolate oxidase FAD binding subunit